MALFPALFKAAKKKNNESQDNKENPPSRKSSVFVLIRLFQAILMRLLNEAWAYLNVLKCIQCSTLFLPKKKLRAGI